MWCSSWDWLPDVHYCCGCIGLRCGSIIIAIFSIVSAIFVVYAFVITKLNLKASYNLRMVLFLAKSIIYTMLTSLVLSDGFLMMSASIEIKGKIFFGGPAAVLYFVFACSTHIVVTILFYFLIVLCVIHVIMALIFLIGICADFPITGEMFIWSIIVTNILAAIILLLAGCIGVPGCLIMFLIGLIVLLINFIIAAYFIIVINSYKNTDM